MRPRKPAEDEQGRPGWKNGPQYGLLTNQLPRPSPDSPSEAEPARTVVTALRRILRAVDLHSRRLRDEVGLSAPQLAALRALGSEGPLSPARIAQRIHLSRPTVTGIVARLGAAGLVSRTPSPADRRSVLIALTERGRAFLDVAPSSLQEVFQARLQELQDWERTSILATLQRIASMMDAAELDASPHLVTTSNELSLAPSTEADGVSTEAPARTEPAGPDSSPRRP